MTILHAIRTTAFRCAVSKAMLTAMFCAAAFIVSAAPNTFGQSPLLNGIGAELAGESTVQNGLFLQGKDSYRVVDTAGFRTAADLGTSQAGTVAQVGFNSGCRSCGTASCGGSCGSSDSSCGPCGGDGNGYGYGAGFNNPCAPCESYCYVSLEALYMDHGAFDAFTLSNDFGIGDIQEKLGSRITIGSVPDCVNGWEFTFVGPFKWNRSRRVTAANNGGNPLGTLLRAGPGFNPDDLSSFGDLSEFSDPTIQFPELIPTATVKSQRYESEYWSLETNRTMFAGEYAKLLFGGRYMSFEGLFEYNSLSPAGQGQLLSVTDNDLYGMQVGMDLLYPVCCNGYADMRTRGGVYANRAANLFRLINAGGLVQGGADATTEFSTQFEFGAGIRYRIGETLSVRLGSELWYLSGVATSTSQVKRVITPNTGRRTKASKDILFAGISLGFEVRY